MPPKSKKAIDEPPAHSTRAQTDGASDANSKSRKHAADFFDGEIGENSEKVVPRSKVPKAKTAKQTAEVEANSKPIHIDHAYDELEETRAAGASEEAEPTAHAISHAKTSKAKAAKGENAKSADAGDSTEHVKAKKDKALKGKAAELGDEGDSTELAKPKKNKATTGEAVRSGKEDESAKPTKSKKGKTTKGEVAKPSKVDGHPIETEKTHPGGDSMEVELAERTQGKKGKPTKGADAQAAPTESAKAKGTRGRPKKANEKVNASTTQDDHDDTETAERAQGKNGKAAKGASAEAAPVEPTKAQGKRGRPKKTDNTANASSAHDDHMETEKIHPGGDRVVIEPTEPAKDKKGKTTEGKTTEGKAADETSAPTAKSKGKSRVSKMDESNADTSNPQENVVEPSNKKPAKTEKVATRTAEPKASNKPAAGKDKPAKSEGKSGSAKQAAGTEPQKKAEKTKAPSAKTKTDTTAADVDSDMVMDDSVFDSLLSTTDMGKQPVDQGPTFAEKSKPAKASKKASHDQPKVDTSAKATAKPEKKPKDAPEAPITKSKKRKSPNDLDADAVKKNVLDPLADLASAKKKQKKSQPGALGVVGSLLGSTVDSAKKKAKAVIDYAGDITGSAPKSIVDDVPGVAEGVVEEKKKRTKGDNVPSEEHSEEAKAPEDENASADEDDVSFFGDTEFLKGFESSGDERDDVEDVDFTPDIAVPALYKDKAEAALERTASSSNTNPGYIYVGRVPHGFYESQMRAYFAQFGHITNLRLSRNKTTGRSKHFAFIEFQSEEVAKIVAQTMDSYLLFGHILKVSLISKEQLHPDTFKGANRRFTAVPWAKIQGRELAMPVGREHWEKRVEKEKGKREKKAEKAKEIGYEFDASLKGVDSVPVMIGKGKDTIEEALVEEEEQTLITHEDEGDRSLTITQTTKVKKSKGKGKEVEAASVTTVKKGKRKAEEAQDAAMDAAESLTEPAAKKVRKGKDKAVDSVAKGKEGVSKEAAAVAKKTAEKARKAMK